MRLQIGKSRSFHSIKIKVLLHANILWMQKTFKIGYYVSSIEWRNDVVNSSNTNLSPNFQLNGCNQLYMKLRGISDFT